MRRRALLRAWLSASSTVSLGGSGGGGGSAGGAGFVVVDLAEAGAGLVDSGTLVGDGVALGMLGVESAAVAVATAFSRRH